MSIKNWFSNLELATITIIILCGSPFVLLAVHTANHVINPPIITAMNHHSRMLRSSLYNELKISDDYHYSNGLTPPVLQSRRYPVLDEL